jgi:hypothetical protein
VGHRFFHPSLYSDYIILVLSYLLAVLLLGTLSIGAYIVYKAYLCGGGAIDEVDAADSGTHIESRGDIVFSRVFKWIVETEKLHQKVYYIILHLIVSWASLVFAFYFFNVLRADSPEVLFNTHLIKATFPLAVSLFMICYVVVCLMIRKSFGILSLKQYLLAIVPYTVCFNLLFLTGEMEIHIVQLISLLFLILIFSSIKMLNKKTFHPAFTVWKDKPRFIKGTVFLIAALLTAIMALTLASVLMGYGPLPPTEYSALQVELYYVITSLVLFFMTLCVGKRRGLLGPGVFLILLAFPLMYAEYLRPKVTLPDALIDEPSLLFKRDRVLEPIYKYQGGKINDARIYMPREVQIETSLAEIDHRRSYYSYCCRAYVDRLRFAFDVVDLGPVVVDNIESKLSGKYGHPFWELFNVRYIVDDFAKRPELLPPDANSYERLSDWVISLKGTKPLLYFMESYEVMDIESFLDAMDDDEFTARLRDTLFIHDEPGKPLSAHTGDSSNSGVNGLELEITEWVSGGLRANVKADRDAFVVFSEVWAPSWNVYVDGEKKKLLRAYGMLQAVRVGKGTHEVYFKFSILSSWKMKLCVAAALSVLFSVIILVLRRAIKGRYKEA